MRAKSMMNALKQKSQQGVMLLEAMVAILIFSIGIVAVMEMQAASIAQVTQAKFRTDASYLANQILGKMWVDMPNVPSYSAAGYTGRAAWDTVVANSLPMAPPRSPWRATRFPSGGGADRHRHDHVEAARGNGLAQVHHFTLIISSDHEQTTHAARRFTPIEVMIAMPDRHHRHRGDDADLRRLRRLQSARRPPAPCPGERQRGALHARARDPDRGLRA